MACCCQIPQWLKDIPESSYCTFLISLVRVILSFVDPTTDILTLVEFYRADHKTWFAVGLTFVILPCVILLAISFLAFSKGLISRTEAFVCGWNPFSPAWVKLQICWRNFKICRGAVMSEGPDELDLLRYSDAITQCVEAGLESIPQFVIQLYVMNVQQEPVKIIQMISLPVSFLSVAWATFAVTQDFKYLVVHRQNPRTHKCIRFVTFLLLVSSLLFAIGFFTVAYKWWIIGVWGFFVVAWCTSAVCYVCMVQGCAFSSKSISLFMKTRLGLIISLVLFVMVCYTMILFFYFSPFSNTWYSLPVTVCVCSFSVIGPALQFASWCFLKETTNNKVSPTQQKNDSSSFQF